MCLSCLPMTELEMAKVKRLWPDHDVRQVQDPHYGPLLTFTKVREQLDLLDWFLGVYSGGTPQLPGHAKYMEVRVGDAEALGTTLPVEIGRILLGARELALQPGQEGSARRASNGGQNAVDQAAKVDAPERAGQAAGEDDV